MNGTEIILDGFKNRSANEPEWLQGFRKKALVAFEEQGFPTSREELWRFTNVSAVEQQVFESKGRRVETDTPAIEGLEKYRLVFVNGKLCEGVSSALPAGLTIGSIADHVSEQQERLGKLASQQSAFVAANSALFADGAFIELADGVELDAPIHLVYVVDAAASIANVRNLIVCGKKSRLAVVEHYVGAENTIYWTNAVTEVFVDDDAYVDHYKIQRESSASYHFQTLEAQVGANAVFSNHAVTLGSALGRNDIRGKMVGEFSEAICNGLYLLKEKQHFDTHLFMDHAVPNCNSHQLYKGIMDDKARAVFCGRILVQKDAQKTDAVQSNKNLLLSRSAKINTLPQLEIYADDVKCTHGATIGELDETALYYLQTRGIDREKGHAMLTFAFANEVLDGVLCAPVKAYVEAFVHIWLAEASV